MSAFAQLTREIQAAWPVERYANLGILIGVSGGADSVALVRALTHLRSNLHQRSPDRVSGYITIAHFNHNLRGSFSEGDEAFVRELGKEMETEVIIDRANRLPTDEASLRQVRMDFLLSTAKRIGARYIALAHHRNDNVETVLHHLLRGTGPTGMNGIPPSRVIQDDFVLVRPLLNVDRKIIRQALQEIGQTWREDESNQDSTYTRNWIRNELLPLIQTRFPNADDAIVRAVEGWRQSWEVVDVLAQQWIEQHEFFRAGEIDSAMFRQASDTQPAVVIRAMQLYWDRRGWARGRMSQAHWNSLQHAMTGQPPYRFQLPGPVDVVVAKDAVYLKNAAC